MTLTYKFNRQGDSIGLCSFEFLDPENCENKKKIQRSSLYTSRDREGHVQGHVTLTYKVTRQGYCIGLCFFEFLDPKNPKNKKKIIALACIQAEMGKVTYKVTWPWRTRSPAKVTVLVYVSLSFLTRKTLKQKKIIFLACLQPKIGIMSLTSRRHVVILWRHLTACQKREISIKYWL